MDDRKALGTEPGCPQRLDPRNLKGLAHPLRLRLLGSLREEGPGTATMLAKRLGESSGSTSYHLRQLAEFGFIEEDAKLTTAHERWWRASRPSTSFDAETLTGEPLLGSEFLRAVASEQAERAMRWVSAIPDTDGPWRGAGTLSDWGLELSPKEARALEAELEAVIGRYARFDPEKPRVAGKAFVAVQLQILPKGAGTEP
jgi:hypothetical protein